MDLLGKAIERRDAALTQSKAYKEDYEHWERVVAYIESMQNETNLSIAASPALNEGQATKVRKEGSGRTPLSNDIILQICDLYRVGKPVAFIAEKVGVSQASVSRYAKKNGIQRLIQGFLSCEDLADRIVYMHEKGSSYKAIVKALNVSPSAIHRAVANRRKIIASHPLANNPSNV